MSFGNRRLATPILATLIDMSELGMVQAQATKAPEGAPLAACITAAGTGFSTPSTANASISPIQEQVLIDTAPDTPISTYTRLNEISYPDADGEHPGSVGVTADAAPAMTPTGTPEHEIQVFAATLANTKGTRKVTGASPLQPVTSDPTTMTTFDIMSWPERDSCMGASTIADRIEGDALIEGLPNGIHAMLVFAADGAMIAGSPFALNAPAHLDTSDIFARRFDAPFTTLSEPLSG